MDTLAIWFDEMGLDADALYATASYVGILAELEEQGWEEQSWAIIFNFLRNAEQPPEYVDGLNRIAYTFDMADFINFMREYTDFIFGNDTFMQIYDMPLFADIPGMNRAEIENVFNNEMEYVFAEMERASGDVTAAFYLDNNDRLSRLALYGDFSIPGEGEAAFTILLDLGDSATDTWQISVSASEDGDEILFATVRWDIGEIGGRHIHELDFSVTSPDLITGGVEFFTLTSEWNRESGEFALFAGQDDVGRMEVFGGNLMTSETAFRLSFNSIEEGADWRRGFAVQITTVPYTNIGDVDFVNIGEWGFEDFEALAASFIMNVMGFDFDEEF
jgi:hypothetical protein